jgi:nucleoside 2-deoxyribosyltransferase
MKLYFAGPLFTTAARAWNAEVTASLRAAGHEVFLPQEKEPGKDAQGIFAADVGAIDAAEGLIAVMDGLDPDSGTCWEVGYAHGTGKPIVLVRTDIRSLAGDAGMYNPVLESGTVRLDLPAASTTQVVSSVIDALGRLEGGIG